jgi:hypothetical protein
LHHRPLTYALPHHLALAPGLSPPDLDRSTLHPLAPLHPPSFPSRYLLAPLPPRTPAISPSRPSARRTLDQSAPHPTPPSAPQLLAPRPLAPWPSPLRRCPRSPLLLRSALNYLGAQGERGVGCSLENNCSNCLYLDSSCVAVAPPKYFVFWFFVMLSSPTHARLSQIHILRLERPIGCVRIPIGDAMSLLTPAGTTGIRVRQAFEAAIRLHQLHPLGL